jgi:hypothetical protein
MQVRSGYRLVLKGAKTFVFLLYVGFNANIFQPIFCGRPFFPEGQIIKTNLTWISKI